MFLLLQLHLRSQIGSENNTSLCEGACEVHKSWSSLQLHLQAWSPKDLPTWLFPTQMHRCPAQR